MDEAKYEAALDRRVQRRLATDPAYRNAANAEEQSAREQEIEILEELALLNDIQVSRLNSGQPPSDELYRRRDELSVALEAKREADDVPARDEPYHYDLDR